jgi:hypothetical protein
MNNNQLMEFAAEKFKTQLGLELSDILSLEGDRFVIGRDNRLGLSMASLQLDLSADEHGIMGDFLSATNRD